MTPLEIVKMLLGLEGTSDTDALLSYLLKTTENKVLNYINHSKLPEELKDVVIEITVNRYRSQQADVSEDKTVKALTVGGVRTEFGDDKSGQGLNQFIDSYRQQLNRFRRMKS